METKNISRQLKLKDVVITLDIEDYTELVSGNYRFDMVGKTLKVYNKVLRELITLKKFIYQRANNSIIESMIYLTFKDNDSTNYTRENIIKGRERYSNKTKYKGVYKNRSGKFFVVITEGEKRTIGVYKDEITAAIAYNKALDLLLGKGKYIANVLDIPNDIYLAIYNVVIIDIMKRNNHQGANRKHRKTTSKYTGVSYYKERGNWKSKIFYKDKDIFIGYYKTEIEAAQAYNEVAIFLYGSTAKINPIPKPLHVIVDLTEIKTKVEKQCLDVEKNNVGIQTPIKTKPLTVAEFIKTLKPVTNFYHLKTGDKLFNIYSESIDCMHIFEYRVNWYGVGIWTINHKGERCYSDKTSNWYYWPKE